MKIDAAQPIKDLSGEPVVDANQEGITVGVVIARALAQTESNDPVRSYVLAQKFFAEESIDDLNDSDVEFVTMQLKKQKLFHPFVIGQILTALK